MRGDVIWGGISGIVPPVPPIQNRIERGNCEECFYTQYRSIR